MQKEDDEGKLGVKIGKELMHAAGATLQANVTRLAPKVLPVSEMLIFAGNMVCRKVTHLPTPSPDSCHALPQSLSCGLCNERPLARAGQQSLHVPTFSMFTPMMSSPGTRQHGASGWQPVNTQACL